MTNKTKTIFITNFHSFISKNILDTDVLKILSGQKNLRIVIFVPSYKEDFFKKRYASEGMIIEGMNSRIITDSKTDTLFSRIAFLLIDSHYLWYKKKERLIRSKSLRGYLKYFLEICFTKLFSNLKIINKVFRFLDFNFAPKKFFKKYFEKYQPCCVFATDIFSHADTAILRESKANKVFTVGMVRSWDNAYSKGLLRSLPDKTMVNNKIIKKEMQTLHNVRAKDMTIVGLPQFDSHFYKGRAARKDFFKDIGVKPSKRLILFAPAGSILSDTDWQICQIFKNASNKGLLPPNIHFLVRNHPCHPASLEKFASDKNFTVEIPGVRFEVGNLKDTELTPKDIRHLADSLYHSEIVIYVATSIGLDAAVFNKPQIMISFDGWEKKPYIESVERYHNEEHMRKLVDTGGVRVVKSSDELIYWINQYLQNPKIGEEGRKKVVKEQLWKLDGKAGERVAQFILSQI